MDELLGEYGSLIVEVIAGSAFIVFIYELFLPVFGDFVNQFLQAVI